MDYIRFRAYLPKSPHFLLPVNEIHNPVNYYAMMYYVFVYDLSQGALNSNRTDSILIGWDGMFNKAPSLAKGTGNSAFQRALLKKAFRTLYY